MNPLKLYDYLIAARGRFMPALRTLTPEQYHRTFNFGLGSIASTTAHLMISEWYFMERFAEREVAPYAEWPIQYEKPPGLDVIEREWPPQAARIRATIAAERDWSRSISWLSFPDQAGQRFHVTGTADDFIAQIALHEVHHRSQLMSMLRCLGDGVAPVQNIDYVQVAFERRPAE